MSTRVVIVLEVVDLYTVAARRPSDSAARSRVGALVNALFAALAADGVVATFHVVDGSVVLVVFCLGGASSTGMVGVVAVAVGPAISHSSTASGSGSGRGRGSSRRGGGGVRVSGRARGLLAQTFMVLGDHEGLEEDECALGRRAEAPGVKGMSEDTGLLEDLEGNAKGLGIGDRVSAGGGEAASHDDLVEHFFNGGLRVPRGFHVVLIGVQVISSDRSIVDLQVREHVMRGDGGVAKGVLLEVGQVGVGDRLDDLGLELGFNGFGVLEDSEEFGMCGKLGGAEGGSSSEYWDTRMDWADVDGADSARGGGRSSYDLGHEGVLRRGHDCSKVAVGASSKGGGNAHGVGIELSAQAAECRCGRVAVAGQRGEFLVWERERDRTSRHGEVLVC